MCQEKRTPHYHDLQVSTRERYCKYKEQAGHCSHYQTRLDGGINHVHAARLFPSISFMLDLSHPSPHLVFLSPSCLLCPRLSYSPSYPRTTWSSLALLFSPSLAFEIGWSASSLPLVLGMARKQGIGKDDQQAWLWDLMTPMQPWAAFSASGEGICPALPGGRLREEAPAVGAMTSTSSSQSSSSGSIGKESVQRSPTGWIRVYVCRFERYACSALMSDAFKSISLSCSLTHLPGRRRSGTHTNVLFRISGFVTFFLLC